MILERLILNNFGVFRDENVLELAPRSKDKPIVLVGGLNGGGKTTILDAIQLVLFGKLSRCSTRGNLPYEDFLRRCITRDVAPKEGAFIELHFSSYQDGDLHQYILVRSWNEARSRIKEAFLVCKDGVDEPHMAETWLDQVDMFLPLGLAELFFFDGEKIARLAGSENSAEMLATAINTLLGIDLVDRLERDLEVYERDLREVVKGEDLEHEVSRLEREASKASEEFQRLIQLRASAQSALDAGRRQLEKAEYEFRRHGGELFSRRRGFEASLRELREQEKAIETGLRTVAAGLTPLLLVNETTLRVRVQCNREQESRKQQMLLAELEIRDREILAQLDKDEIPTLARVTLEALFKQDIAERQKKARVPELLSLDRETSDRVYRFRDEDLAGARQEAIGLLRSLDRLRERLAAVEEQLTQVPDEGAISAHGQALVEARTLTARREGELLAISAQIEEQSRFLIEKEKQLKAALDRRIELSRDGAVVRRKLEYAAKTRKTMRAFRSLVLQKKVKQIESEILSCFRQLLRKETLIGGVAIEPTSYRMSLSGSDGVTPIPTDRLSAGERQLLAIATLWGLARVSGRPLPTIVDTPLGRLDSQHRINLVENYFPTASHQVIILSTDEEIDEGYLRRLRPYVGHMYELVHSDETKSTEIRDGYFF